MKSVGSSYPDWSYYAPPPPPNSNLSAFAAPFSVNPYSASDVSAESAETVSPIHSQSYGYDFLSNPVREIDSSARFPHLGLSSFAGRSSLVEAQPYHPSYSAIHGHSSSVAPYHWSLDWPSLMDANKSPPELGFSTPNAASWDQFPDFNNAAGEKRFGVWSTLPQKETNAVGSVSEERTNQNLGNQDVKDSAVSEVSNMIDWEKHNVLANGNHLHDTSSCWGTIKPIPVELSGSCVMQSSIMSLDTHPDVPLKVSADSINNHLSNIGSYVQPSIVDNVSSMPGAGLVTDLNIENIIADEPVDHNNFCNTKESFLMHSPGTTGSCFDTGHLRMHLGRNEPSSSSKAMISDNDVSRDVVDYIFRGRDGFQNPHANFDNLSLRLSAVEDVNFGERTFESGDRCNPAEDSPCWKGASTAHFSRFEPSLALPPNYVHKEGFGSVIQDPHSCVLDTEIFLKKSCEKTSSVGSPRKFSLKKTAFQDCKSGGVVNDGPFQSKPSSDHGLQQFLDVIKMKEMKKNCVKLANSIDYESGSPHTEHQVVEENKLMSQKQNVSCTGDADAGCNVNECLEAGIFCTAKPALPSPLLVAPGKSTGEVSTERLNVQMLVDTMQNLSELLLNHCLNDACELKERDCNALKNVICNLNTCALKNAEQIAPSQESLCNQPETSKPAAGESHKFLKHASLKKPELTKIGPASSKVEFENPHVAEENLHFRFGGPHRNLSDSVSPWVDTERTETDKATKDLKKILMENFDDGDDEGAEPQTVLYKNLWLEAEAALCSVNYRARYHQMKSEMDKYFCKAKENEKQTQSEVVPTLSQSQSSAAEVHNYSDPDSASLKLAATDMKTDATDMETSNSVTPKGKGNYSDPDSTALKLAALDASTILEELSRLNLSTDMKRPNSMTPEGKGGQNLDSFIDNYAVCCSDKEAETNNEASVMARYQVLKARVDHKCIDTTHQEEPLEVADKSSPGGMNNQNQDNLCHDSPIPEDSRIDYPASVVARFHILKSRIEGSSSISSEGSLLDGVEFAGKAGDDIAIAKNVSGCEIHPNDALALAHFDYYATLEKSMPKRFGKIFEGSQEIQPCEAWEFQSPTFQLDGFSSDWEHVEKSL